MLKIIIFTVDGEASPIVVLHLEIWVTALWSNLIETTVESLTLVRTLTTKLQESVLTPGKILGHWQLTMLSQEHISTTLTTILMERMKEREKSLMIPPVLAATYLDPEYQVLLTEEQQNSATIELQALCS